MKLIAYYYGNGYVVCPSCHERRGIDETGAMFDIDEQTSAVVCDNCHKIITQPTFLDTSELEAGCIADGANGDKEVTFKVRKFLNSMGFVSALDVYDNDAVEEGVQWFNWIAYPWYLEFEAGDCVLMNDYPKEVEG